MTRDDPRAQELIRHDLAHVLAEAVQRLWPGTRTAIGPAIEHGFYYDFERETPFTPEDLPVIEAKMREIIASRTPFVCETWTRDQARAHFEAAGESYKLALLDAIPEGEPVTIYRQGDWLDLCRGPHMRHTGDAGAAFKLTRVAGAYLPLWLAPVQVVAATITGAADEWAAEVAQTLRTAGLRVETDLRNEKISYKVREHALKKIPVQIALGMREAEERTVTIRRHGETKTQTLPLSAAVALLAQDAQPPAAR